MLLLHRHGTRTLTPAKTQAWCWSCAVLQRRKRMGLPDGNTDPALDEFSDEEYQFNEVRGSEGEREGESALR